MNYFVKELADKSAILVAIDGYELAAFPSVEVAINTCREECLVRPLWIERHYNEFDSSPLDFEGDFMQAGEIHMGLSQDIIH